MYALAHRRRRILVEAPVWRPAYQDALADCECGLGESSMPPRHYRGLGESSMPPRHYRGLGDDLWGMGDDGLLGALTPPPPVPDALKASISAQFAAAAAAAPTTTIGLAASIRNKTLLPAWWTASNYINLRQGATPQTGYVSYKIVTVNGVKLWAVPPSYALNEGSQFITDAMAAKANGWHLKIGEYKTTYTPYTNAWGYTVQNPVYHVPIIDAYFFTADPRPFLDVGRVGINYTPGVSGKSITTGAIIGVASVVLPVVGGVLAAPLIFAAPAAAGAGAGTAAGLVAAQGAATAAGTAAGAAATTAATAAGVTAATAALPAITATGAIIGGAAAPSALTSVAPAALTTATAPALTSTAPALTSAAPIASSAAPVASTGILGTGVTAGQISTAVGLASTAAKLLAKKQSGQDLSAAEQAQLNAALAAQQAAQQRGTMQAGAGLLLLLAAGGMLLFGDKKKRGRLL